MERIGITFGDLIYHSSWTYGYPSPQATVLSDYTLDHTKSFVFGHCSNERGIGLNSFKVNTHIWGTRVEGGFNGVFWQPSSDFSKDSAVFLEGGGAVSLIGLAAGSPSKNAIRTAPTFTGVLNVYGEYRWGGIGPDSVTGGAVKIFREAFGEFACATQGWTVHNHVNGFSWHSGCVTGTVTGVDPSIVSPSGLNVNITAKKKVKVRMRNGTSSRAAQTYFTTRSDGVWSEAKSKGFAIVADDQNHREYVVDMSDVAGWNDSLLQLRLDPNSGVTSGSFSVDHVRIASEQEMGGKGAKEYAECSRKWTDAMIGEPIYQVSCREEDGLPVAVVSGGAGHPHAHHPLAGWRLKANVYLDGSVRLFSGEFGSRFFGPAPFHAGARRAALQFATRIVELDYNRLGARRELGLGTFTARVEFSEGTLIHRVIIPDMDGRELLMAWEWEGRDAPKLLLPVESPADAGPYGRIYYIATGADVRREGPAIHASLATPLVIRAGYTAGAAEPPGAGMEEFRQAWTRLGDVWRGRLAKINTPFVGGRLWELQWSVGLMLGSCIHDGARGQLACTNGALYAFDHLSPQFDQPVASCSFRDGNQVAFALCAIEPRVAREQILRNFTAFRRDWGIPQASNARPGGEHIYKTPGSSGGEVHSVAFASKQTYWAILALTEYVAVTGDCQLLDERIANAQGETKSVREHLDDMLRFSDETVGYGANGICRFLSGDWNDYLDDIGSRGPGESFMNAALNIIAKSRLAVVDEDAGRPDSARRLRAEAEAMRARVAPYCRGRWYPRAIADDGRLLGGSDERLYADAQGWLAMARCGDVAFRRQALLTTMERCLDPIGLRIIDRPLQADERAGISRVPYAPGTGENGGIWWITGHWLAMALDQEGLATEALQVYDTCSMRNHHRLFPREWWSPLMCPDGIDGPVSPDYGRAQQPPGCNRESNPNESAKFAFALWFATHRGGGMCVAET